MAKQFQVGQRVSGIFYGRQMVGTVEKHKTSVVYVLWDGKQLPTWCFADSLTLVTA